MPNTKVKSAAFLFITCMINSEAVIKATFEILCDLLMVNIEDVVFLGRKLKHVDVLPQ